MSNSSVDAGILDNPLYEDILINQNAVRPKLLTFKDSVGRK
ncbi:hypothetical protein T4B_1782 [Trichinella pseudospiralis]|uniref:Uncharacterized protein n=1 Tax=Trichinella pseudospiralis TaxID=6337 RepID=A0A0V1GPP6_TRIPS|nr:hypothetical protein T4B_1782 [Trichinella pseudospiralis]